MHEPGYVLDASALLALFFGEPGGDYVADRLDGAAISTVNLCEVVAKSLDRKMSDEAIHLNLADANLIILPFDEQTAFRAGTLRPVSRHVGLSLADRACLAAAELTDRIALTADRAWAGLDIGVRIELIR